MFYCYILRCNDASLYVGSTRNIEERLQTHNEGAGSVYTKQRLPVILVYHESFSTRQEAVKRERQIKGWTRIKKENLIIHGHPKPSSSLKP